MSKALNDTNWAGNLTYSAATIHTPQTLDELQTIVRENERVRALGSRHSFNTIADTDAALVSMQALNRIVEIDADANTVTVEGGITYGDLSPALDRAGFALHNLASLPHISVVGACMTATHGSGVKNGNLAAAVSALEIVRHDGELAHYSRAEHPDTFPGLVVSLGAAGIVARVTLDILPRFEVAQTVYPNLDMAQLDNHLDEVLSAAYSVSLFTRWQGTIDQVWVKRHMDEGPAPETLFGVRPASEKVSPVGDDLIERCTDQLGVSGAWYARLPHFKMEFTPSHGDELQSEYFVPHNRALDAIHALRPLSADISPLLHISEIRTIAADNLWLSPAYEQDCVAIHFTWKPNGDAVHALLPRIEAALSPFGAVPHWGKVFTMDAAQVRAGYARMGDFCTLVKQIDPAGKFRNAFVDEYAFA